MHNYSVGIHTLSILETPLRGQPKEVKKVSAILELAAYENDFCEERSKWGLVKGAVEEPLLREL